MSGVRRVRIDLAYDGAPYVGWQMQPNGLSVQQVMEEALAIIFPDAGRIVVNASGRTDAGVHALAQPVDADLPDRLADHELMRALNGILPPSVAVIAVATVAPDWSARHDATRKSYRYLIHNSPVPDPFLADRAWRVAAPLDLAAMNEGAGRLLGPHDFTSFRAMRCACKSPVRRILSLTVTRDGDRVVIDVTGTGFLKHMVRNIVGALVEVGLRKRPPGWIADLLAARDRQKGARCAPPGGLYMVAVAYDGPKHRDIEDDDGMEA